MKKKSKVKASRLPVVRKGQVKKGSSMSNCSSIAEQSKQPSLSPRSAIRRAMFKGSRAGRVAFGNHLRRKDRSSRRGTSIIFDRDIWPRIKVFSRTPIDARVVATPLKRGKSCRGRVCGPGVSLCHHCSCGIRGLCASRKKRKI